MHKDTAIQESHQIPLPTVGFGPHRVTRLILGGNPLRGNSHQTPELDHEMEAYFTVSRVKQTLQHSLSLGINTVQARGDVLIQACLREHWAEGGTMQIIAQTASELRDLEGHVRQLARFGAIGIYVHGTFTDRHYQRGSMDEVRRLLETTRETGVQAGIGTHMPEVVDYVEEQGWEPDFYMTSLYNLSRTERESALVSGQSAGAEHFDHEDRHAMFERIQGTSKPCLVFKVFGAGRRCATTEEVRQVLAETYRRIKPSDAVVVGMFPKHRDEIAENTRIVRDLLSAPDSTRI